MLWSAKQDHNEKPPNTYLQGLWFSHLSVPGSGGWTDLSWGARLVQLFKVWKLQRLAVCSGWSNSPDVWVTRTTVRIVGSCRDHIGFTRDVEGEIEILHSANTWVLADAGPTLEKKRVETTVGLPILAFLSLPYNFSDSLDIFEVPTLNKMSMQLPAPICTGLAHWDRFTPSKSALKAGFAKAKCFGVFFLI